METMLKEIQLRLGKPSINGINQNKNQIQTVTKNKSKVDKIEKQFKISLDSIVKTSFIINVISNNFVSRKNYYSKPIFLTFN